MNKPGRRRDEAARERIRAVLDAEGSSELTHAAVAELTQTNPNIVREVRRERGDVAGRRKRKPPAPRAPKPKPAPPPTPQPLTRHQGDVLAMVIETALGGRDTRRLLTIRGLLNTITGRELQAAAETARRAS